METLKALIAMKQVNNSDISRLGLILAMLLSQATAFLAPGLPSKAIRPDTVLSVSTMADVTQDLIFEQPKTASSFKVPPPSRSHLKRLEIPRHVRPSTQAVQNTKMLGSLEMTMLRIALLGSCVFIATELSTGLSLPEQLAAMHLLR